LRSTAGNGCEAKLYLGWWGLVAACLAVLFAAASAEAAEVVLSAGEYDVERARDDGPLAAGLVVRLTGTEVWRSKGGWALVPAFGVMGSEENAFYGWAGGALQIPINSHWGLVPQLGMGVYRQGDGKNLGGSLEFRSGLELVFRASDTLRVGAEFSHLSNAGFHELNPGVNSIVLTFAVGRSHAFRSSPMPRTSAPSRSDKAAAGR
jgi:lipid A 3-O-deacylase